MTIPLVYALGVLAGGLFMYVAINPPRKWREPTCHECHDYGTLILWNGERITCPRCHKPLGEA